MTQNRAKRLLLPALCMLGLLLFIGLGIWQVERLNWKLELIARVDRRVQSAPVAAPGKAAWPTLQTETLEYQPVRATGRFVHDRETLVDALTERGAGFWVMTPLDTKDGTILVNRGFVPPDRADRRTRSPGPLPESTTVAGLLRRTEPDGRFLRPNRPGENRWYSRDVTAIADARGVAPVAPYFIDADATANPGGWPVGGLTVVRFRNAHLIYALTWFGLAALSLLGLWLLRRDMRQAR